jgi:hypothetical protein
LVVARMRPVGTRAGSDIEGGWVSVPIEICKNCLAPQPAPCPPPKGTVVLPGNPCNPAQDAPVTCCSTGGAVICGSTVMPAM